MVVSISSTVKILHKKMIMSGFNKYLILVRDLHREIGKRAAVRNILRQVDCVLVWLERGPVIIDVKNSNGQGRLHRGQGVKLPLPRIPW